MKKLISTTIVICLTTLAYNQEQGSYELAGYVDIIIQYDTISLDSNTTILSHEGDVLNGKIVIQKNKSVIENGIVLDKKNGTTSIYYKDGWISGTKSYNNDHVLVEDATYYHGTLNGPYKSWYSNGKLKSEGFYSNAFKDSTWTFYYENGNIDSQGAFNAEHLVEDFEINETRIDSETGLQILTTYSRKESALNGTWKFYDLSGELVRTLKFKDGAAISIEYGAPFVTPFNLNE